MDICRAAHLPTLLFAVKKLFLLLLLTCCFSIVLVGQKKNERFHYTIERAHSAIKIDGAVEDSAWAATAVATDFRMVLPMDTSAAVLRTEVRMAYDARFLYVSAVNFQPHPVVVESLRRDFSFGKNDNFIFFMDPFDDQTNGFSFGASASGAEWDGQQFDGGTVNLNWDNRWFSAVRCYTDRWVFEAAIPFKTLRYKKGITRWGSISVATTSLRPKNRLGHRCRARCRRLRWLSRGCSIGMRRRRARGGIFR